MKMNETVNSRAAAIVHRFWFPITTNAIASAISMKMNASLIQKLIRSTRYSRKCIPSRWYSAPGSCCQYGSCRPSGNCQALMGGVLTKEDGRYQESDDEDSQHGMMDAVMSPCVENGEEDQTGRSYDCKQSCEDTQDLLGTVVVMRQSALVS